MAKAAVRRSVKSGFRFSRIHLGISVVLVVALIGFIIYRSQAAENRTVRFMVFCASDTADETCNNTRQLIGGHPRAVRDWYRSRAGASFVLDSSGIIRGGKTEAEYRACTGTCPVDKIDTIRGHLSGESKVNKAGLKTVVVLAFASGGGAKCRSTEVGGNFGVINPFSPHCNGSALPVYMAREAGHLFGLGDGTGIMAAYPACVLDACALSEPHIAQLLRPIAPTKPSPYFRHVRVQEIDPRAASSVKVIVNFKIGDTSYSDDSTRWSAWEDIQLLKFNAHGGTWDNRRQRFTGNFLEPVGLQFESGADLPPNVMISKEDARGIKELTLHFWFTVEGKRYYDAEVMGTWDSNKELILDTTCGTFNSKDQQYTGDFLRPLGEASESC